MTDDVPDDPKIIKLVKRSSDQAMEYLFNKMFLQAAHISILEEALSTLRNDLIDIRDEHNINVDSALVKIDIAHQSIGKLKGK